MPSSVGGLQSPPSACRFRRRETFLFLKDLAHKRRPAEAEAAGAHLTGHGRFPPSCLSEYLLCVVFIPIFCCPSRLMSSILITSLKCCVLAGIRPCERLQHKTGAETASNSDRCFIIIISYLQYFFFINSKRRELNVDSLRFPFMQTLHQNQLEFIIKLI